jgi:hypothetical protein
MCSVASVFGCVHRRMVGAPFYIKKRKVAGQEHENAMATPCRTTHKLIGEPMREYNLIICVYIYGFVCIWTTQV